MLADRQLYPKSSHVLKKQFQVNLWFSDKRTSGILFGSNKHACAGRKISRPDTNINFMPYGSESPLNKLRGLRDIQHISSSLGPSLLLTSVTHIVTTAIVAGETCHQWSEVLPEVCLNLCPLFTCHKISCQTNPSPRVTLV